MGEGDIGESLLERCPGYCCRCEYFLLPSFTRDLIFLEFIPPRSVVYRTICERLEATDRILEATECFQEMAVELGEEVYTSGPMAEWFCGEFIFCPFFSRYPTFSSRFYATTSLDSQSQHWCNFSHAPYTTFEGVGKSKVDKRHMERCPGSCRQCEYFLALSYPSQDRRSVLFAVYTPQDGNISGHCRTPRGH